MFHKILIANRGEIACRIIKTARRMGIATVAVYSEADADALFVDMADEAVLIGPPPAAQSYLDIEKIIAAAKKTGAEAIHPGYGFLSERAAFAQALEAEGVVFIGPNARAIAAMGDKIESKKLAAKARVSTIPGHLGVIKNPKEAIKIAKEIGFPVMIKASAGGGGKGMRIAHSADEVEAGLTSSMNEARNAFGDERVFIEKFITDPRHVEIQVLADKHGNTIHLGERECSIQRRNQKVIEEAPSPLLDEKTRGLMGEQAVALAKAVAYDSAGTVEFIADQARNFFFLEMNTRLQVEHPVTELVTGLDLVEQMIRIAAGEKLALAQNDVKLSGWAIETRVYAEDPYRNFLPSIGRLRRYRPPAEGTRGGLTVRNDSGVSEGGEISIYYDPLISKLVTHGQTRAAAIERMAEALNEFDISGVEHNLAFLGAVMAHPRFRGGRLSTAFIAEEFPGGFKGAELAIETLADLVCVAVHMHLTHQRRERTITGRIAAPPPIPAEWIVALGPRAWQVGVLQEEKGVEIAFADGSVSPRTIESEWRPGLAVHRARIEERPITVLVERFLDGYVLRHAGAVLEATVRTPRAAALAKLMPAKRAADTSKYLLCPMPGLVVEILVGAGTQVKTGEPLAVVEAMKMENVLKAERDGTVKKVNAKKGQSLQVDDVILEFA
jgi:propionyl-CoA carboxylase alpha chain